MSKKSLRLVTDKDLIVFLVANGMEIKAISKDQIYQRSNVYFDNSEQLENAILNYTNKSVTINIGDYQAAERRVKTLLCFNKC